MMEKQAIFIAGTDTGVGKTLVAGLLAQYLISLGKKVVTQKWVATGTDNDIKCHQKIIGTNFKEPKNKLIPYVFKLAASPHLAAKVEHKSINKQKMKKSFLSLLKHYDVVIVEGTGGLLVPISNKGLLIDIVKDLKLPVLFVAHNKLGAINHTLLSIEALKMRRIPIVGVIFNNLSKTKKIILEDNQRIVGEIGGVSILGELPKSKNMKLLKSRFQAIGEKIAAYELD